MLRSTLREALNIVPSNKHLYFFHQKDGKILELIGTPHLNLAEAAEILSRTGSLEPYFDFSRLKDDDTLIALAQRTSPGFRLPFLGLHTLLPQYTLVSRCIGENTYLGRFATIEFHPRVETHAFHNPIFVDTRTDALVGFSETFHGFFRKDYPDPESMLGLPVGTFLTPSPHVFQESMIPEFKPDAQDGFKTVHPTEGFLPDQDLIATVDIEILEGEGPSFVLGGDLEGYQAGPASGYWIVKRKGLVAASAGRRGLCTGKQRFHFCKVGRSLLLFMGGQKVIAYYDPDFAIAEQARFSLFLREGTRCGAAAITLRVRKSDPAGPWKRYVARLKDNSNRIFAADPFSNNTFSQPLYFHASAYFLNDITEMQGRIRELSVKVRSLMLAPAFIGESPAIRSLKETARLAASTDAMVLIEGPTGAGKEVLARYIHEQSGRKAAPFVKVDCATIPQNLIESRLFGHEKGAFTGAVARSIGLFESAEGGTIFLDEVGNLSTEVQAKLLQFLNDHTLTRVGGDRPMRLNVRLIAASNVSLSAMVGRGRFREDLFFRLNVVYLYTPSLASRPEDVIPLARHFLTLFASEQGKAVTAFSSDAETRLMKYTWPGNVRELANVVQRTVIFAKEGVISAEAIDFPGGALNRKQAKAVNRTPFRMDLTPAKDVARALRKHHGCAEKAAQELGMARATLYKLMKQRKIKPSKYRRGFQGPS